MAYVVLKGEKKLADVVRRSYGELNAADAKRVEAALLRANPQLAQPQELKAGVIVVTPAVPGVRAADGERGEAPAREAVVDLGNSLDEYRKQLAAAQRQEQEERTAVGALLKSKELKAAVGHHPDGEKYVAGVAAALKARGEEHDRRTAFLRTLTQAKSDLDELASKLG